MDSDEGWTLSNANAIRAVIRVSAGFFANVSAWDG